MMRDWRNIWRRLFPRHTIERDIDAELAFHVDGRADDLVEKGLARHAARAEVIRRFGDIDRVRAQCEELSRQRIARKEFRTMMESTAQDARFAARALIKNSGFSLVA